MTGLPTPPRSSVVIATRGSQLALWQADYVAGLLAAHGVSSEKLIVKTTADRVQDRFLHEIGGKGLFVKELEEALADRRADLAVHSLKDMTASLKPPFTLGAVLKRHPASDLMVFRQDVARRLAPPPVLAPNDVAAFGALKVGTGSLRRQALLQSVAPDIASVGIRGNVDTRLKKLDEGQWDAIILAEAAIWRLGLEGRQPASRLAADWFVPCAAQGALALESRIDDPLTDWLRLLACPETTLCCAIERELLARLGGDCTMPLGCHVEPVGDGAGRMLVAHAVILAADGEAAKARYAAPLDAGFDRARYLDELTQVLARAGAGKILARLGLAVPPHFA